MAPKPGDNQNDDGNSCHFDAARGYNSRESDHRSAVCYWRRGTCTALERPCKWPSTGSSTACCRRRTRRNRNRRIGPVRYEMQRGIGPLLRILRTQMSSSWYRFYFLLPIENSQVCPTQSPPPSFNLGRLISSPSTYPKVARHHKIILCIYLCRKRIFSTPNPVREGRKFPSFPSPTQIGPPVASNGLSRTHEIAYVT